MNIQPTQLTELQRAKERGHFDRETINDILDASPLCHLGYQIDDQPIVMPTVHWRIDDHVYWHGSRISRTMLNTEQNSVCLTVTHLDGLVLARSAFHHSANYRSVLVFGKPEMVEDDAEKTTALTQMIDKMMPDRWQSLRPMTNKELNATTVLKLPIAEASAKIRTGGPIDLEEDLDFPVWAGVLPLTVQAGEPIPCPHNQNDQQEPSNLRDYSIG